MSTVTRFIWSSGWTLGVLLLGACVGLEDENPQVDVAGLVQQGQDPVTGDVVVKLSASAASFTAAQDVTVAVSFTNTRRYPVRLLAWQTAAGELEDALFEVTRAGQPVAYIGPHFKRPAAEKLDSVVLAPGKSLTRTVALAGLYDLAQTGDYSIRYSLTLKDPGSKQAVELASSKVGLWIEGRASVNQAVMGDGTSLTAGVSFNKCTTAQQTTVTSALGAAGSLANNAVTYLNGSPAATPRYTTWFGAFSTSGWNTAKDHFVAIKDVYATKPITFDCSCKKKYYAYVYPNQPYVIYLCSVFWGAPLSGTDSQGGTIIHETSHFSVVAGTDDYVYGQSAAKSLATSDPAKALFNADSNEYFAENTPVLM